MEIHNFWGDLTDISASKEPLVASAPWGRTSQPNMYRFYQEPPEIVKIYALSDPLIEAGMGPVPLLAVPYDR